MSRKPRNTPPKLQNWLVALLGVAALLFFAVGGAILSLVFWSCLLLAGVAVSQCLIGKATLKLELSVPETTIYVGDRIRLLTTIQNTGSLTWPMLRYAVSGRTSTLFSAETVDLAIDSRDTVHLERELVCTRRGRYVLGDHSLVIQDSFGLCSLRKENSAALSLTVYPRVRPLRSIRMQGNHQLGEILVSDLLARNQDETIGSRTYLQGDPVRLVHWKLSARSAGWFIKEFERQSDANCVMLLDAERSHWSHDSDGNLLELAVETAASIVDYMLNHKIRLSLRMRDLDSRVTDRLDFDSDYHALMTLLAEFSLNSTSGRLLRQLRQLETDGATGSSLVVIGARFDDAEVLAMERLKRKGIRPIVLLPDAPGSGYATSMAEQLGKLGLAVFRLLPESDLEHAINF